MVWSSEERQREHVYQPRPDAQIERDVRDTLRADVRIDARNVDVVVQDGIVRLEGAVPDADQRALAREVVERLKGVRDVVVDGLTVTPTELRSDVDITADVVAALTRDSIVDERKIEVETRDGVVYLRGVVGSYTERKAADTDARTTPGVVDVINELTVALAYSRTDEAVLADVQMALETNIAADLSDVQVEVKNGVVHLSGDVATVEVRWLIDETIRWVPGVVDVVNDLGVVTLQGP